MKTIYLDNNATTQVAPEVLETMLPYFHELYGNPSSMHSFGGQVAKKIREAHEQAAALIGATPDEIIFTSCGTESDNAAIRSALATHPVTKYYLGHLISIQSLVFREERTDRSALPWRPGEQNAPASHNLPRHPVDPAREPACHGISPSLPWCGRIDEALCPGRGRISPYAGSPLKEDADADVALLQASQLSYL